MSSINFNSSPANYPTPGQLLEDMDREENAELENLSLREQDFLHLSDEKKDWIDDRLEKCPLTKLQCDSDNQN